MIRLTLIYQTQPHLKEVHLFDKESLLIGSDPSLVDLFVNTQSSNPVHFKIKQENNTYSITNEAHDPFATVSEIPFGKRDIQSGDILKSEGFSLLFEEMEPISEQNAEPSEAAHLSDDLLETDKQPNHNSSSHNFNLNIPHFTLAFEKEVIPLSEEELSAIEKNPSFLSLSSDPLQKSSLKDDYLKNLDDDRMEDKKGPFSDDKEPSHLYQAWKWILLFIFSLITLSGAIGTIIYFSMSDKAEAQETKALQGTADIAMALTHAQINQIKPHNHNWSDGEFLKNNLMAILPSTPSHASQIDSKGQFGGFPYTLRIYTSSDLSHFVLVAQPSPSLLSWLFPPSLIVMDSHLMELRTVRDVSALNRLLANPDPLEGNHSQELTELIEEGKLVTLESLAKDSGVESFTPPKNLETLYPAASNRLCNAPRYYKLGQNMLLQASTVLLSKGASQAISSFKQKIEHCCHLTPWILYSDQSVEEAKNARKGMNMYASHEGFLFGRLIMDPKTGKIKGASLLDNEESDDPFDLPETDSNNLAFKTDDLALREPPAETSPPEDHLYTNHPIYIQLQRLLVLREKELKELSIPLNVLLEKNISYPDPMFSQNLNFLSQELVVAQQKHNNTLKDSLNHLYEQYREIAAEELSEIIHALQLDFLIEEDLNNTPPISEETQRKIETLFEKLEKTTSPIELQIYTESISNELDINQIKNLPKMLHYQETLRNSVLKQIEKFLQSPHTHFSMTEEERVALFKVLENEKLIMEDEKEFFKEKINQIYDESAEEKKESFIISSHDGIEQNTTESKPSDMNEEGITKTSLEIKDRSGDDTAPKTPEESIKVTEKND